MPHVSVRDEPVKRMSTSDAAEQRLSSNRTVGGERATPQCSTTLTRTPTARKQDEIPVNCNKERSVVEAGPCHPLITTKETSTALVHSSKTSKDFTDNSKRPKFTSHFSLKLNTRSGLNKADPDLHKKTDCSPVSFHRPSSVCSEDIFYRVHDFSVYTRDKIPLHVRKVEETQHCINIESCSIQCFSNGRSGLLTENGPQSGLSLRRVNSLDVIVDNIRAKDQTGHSTMLSSTVATVLAPQWSSGRLRRNKREGTGTLDFQGNLQEKKNSSSVVEQMLSNRLQNQQHTPFVRSNTVGWSTRSGPTGLDNERKVHQSASLDMRLDDKRTDRPIHPPLSPLSPSSPMSIDGNEPQRSPQRGHSPLSSKPTISSMLFSLRRVNNNSPLSPTECQTQSPENLDTNRLSQVWQHKNHLSPNFVSNNGNSSRSPSPTHRDRLSKSYNYSTVPSKHTESPYLQGNSSQEAVSPQRSFSRDPPDSIKLNKTPLTLPKRTPYDHTALLKSHSTPRRPLLSSITWLPIENQEGSSQTTPNDNNNKSSVPVTANFNSNNIRTDNAVISEQIPFYRGNKNTVEAVGKANLVQPQGGTASIQQHSPNHLSFVKGQVESCLNREPPKPISLPGALSNSKFSIAMPHTAMSQAKSPTNHNANGGLYSAKVTEFSPTLLCPKSTYTPTDNSSKFQNMYCASKSTPTMQQSKEKVGKQSHLHDITNTVTNANYKSCIDLGQSNKSSFQSTPGSSQANSSASTFSKEETLSPKLNTPLGFERSYVPKPYQAKTNLNPTVSLHSKTSYSPTHADSTTPASSPSYLSPHSPPVTVSSLLTPPSTPSFTSPSSPKTPSPKVNRVFSKSVDLDPKKHKGEKKISKRVTFEDTVNANTDKKQDQLNQLTQRNVKAPSIFNILRSGNQPNTFSPTPKSSCIQIGSGVKYRSLSSDSAELKSREICKQLSSENAAFDYKAHGLNMPRQERTLSAESAVQYRCAPALSLPPDFVKGYKNRYSSPPYSTLVSSRTAQPESKPKLSHSSLFHRLSQPNAVNATANTAAMPVKHPLLSGTSLQLRPVQIEIQDTFKTKDMNLDHDKNPVKPVGECLTNGQIQLVDNRVHISSQSLPGDKSPRISSTCVTETLVYSIRGKTDRTIDGAKNATPRSSANMPVSKEIELSQQLQRKEALKEQDDMSNQSSSSSVESHNIDDDSSKRKIKEVGKSKFYSIECSSEQSPKRSRFALKKSTSTPSASLSRSDSDRTSKVDQMFSKLKQTFSTRRTNNDEESFPKKWKKVSQASGVNDSSTSEISVESNRKAEEEEVTMELNNNDKGVEDKHRWASNRYILVPAPVEQNKMLDETFAMWTDEVMTDPEEQTEKRCSPCLKTHSPNQDHKSFDFKPNQFQSPKDLSPGYSPNSSTTFPSAEHRQSSSCSRSPFSPFPSLSPVSPFSATDVLDDSVFYSPKPPRHRDSSSSPCELGEISLVASRRSRASTGPPSLGPVTNKERMSTTYADLKYGIEPGRSFSVSSVSSSRPSGPGRISTGSRFMSVGDLSKTAFSCGHAASDSDNWSAQCGGQSKTDSQAGRYPNDGKVRSRSLPRSFTQCLSSWGTGQSTSSNSTWSQNVDTVDIPWETEGPPTPPPTPPMSPVTRRMSKPPCLSPPSFTGQSDPPQDNLSPRGLLPSRGYTSSLSTFEESSDSSSDTTTDDEYYLETGEDEEKETEL